MENCSTAKLAFPKRLIDINLSLSVCTSEHYLLIKTPTSLLSASHMECSVTVSPDALNTRALAPPANVTRQLPSGCGDLVDRVYRFQEDWVTKVHFRDPQRAQHVHPPVTLRLFKCSCVNICVVLQQITVFCLIMISTLECCV